VLAVCSPPRRRHGFSRCCCLPLCVCASDMRLRDSYRVGGPICRVFCIRIATLTYPPFGERAQRKRLKIWLEGMFARWVLPPRMQDPSIKQCVHYCQAQRDIACRHGSPSLQRVNSIGSDVFQPLAFCKWHMWAISPICRSPPTHQLASCPFSHFSRYPFDLSSCLAGL
jgi:hypothetical protein